MKQLKLQQGDVLLHKINDVYLSKERKQDNLILAEGEATGHNHQIVSGIAEIILLSGTDEGKRILNVISETALLKHQEHSMKKTIKEFKTKEKIPDDYIEYLKQYEKIDFDNSSFNEIVAKTQHETIISKGKYKIRIVREYDHFEEETRKVID